MGPLLASGRAALRAPAKAAPLSRGGLYESRGAAVTLASHAVRAARPIHGNWPPPGETALFAHPWTRPRAGRVLGTSLGDRSSYALTHSSDRQRGSGD